MYTYSEAHKCEIWDAGVRKLCNCAFYNPITTTPTTIVPGKTRQDKTILRTLQAGFALLFLKLKLVKSV